MHLETARVHPERRPRPLIHHAPVRRSAPLDPHGIYTVGREQLAGVGRRQVDRRDPDGAAATGAAFHHTPQAIGPAEPALRARQVAVGHRLRISYDEIGWPSSVTAATTSTTNPSSWARRRTSSTSPERPRPNP